MSLTGRLSALLSRAAVETLDSRERSMNELAWEARIEALKLEERRAPEHEVMAAWRRVELFETAASLLAERSYVALIGGVYRL